MPGRSSVMLILAFFMTMATLQYARNYGSRLNEAPALKPSLEKAAEDGATEWVLNANGKQLGTAFSQVIKTQSGVYHLRQAVTLNGDLESYVGPLSLMARSFGVRLNDFNAFLRTDMELTYLGTMKTINVGFAARPRPKIVLPGTPAADRERESTDDDARRKEDDASVISLRIKGEVVGDQLVFKGTFIMLGNRFPIDDYKVKYRGRDTYLSNLAPTDCLVGLWPGQRWQTPVLDPAAVMVSAFATSKSKELTSGNFDPDEILGKNKLVEVYVHDELKMLDWHGTQVPCFVVQTGERGARMQVWVNASTSRVLRQLSQWQDKSIELLRLPKKDD